MSSQLTCVFACWMNSLPRVKFWISLQPAASVVPTTKTAIFAFGVRSIGGRCDQRCGFKVACVDLPLQVCSILHEMLLWDIVVAGRRSGAQVLLAKVNPWAKILNTFPQMGHSHFKLSSNVWNSLPDIITCDLNITTCTFKRKLKTFFFSNCYS